MVQIGRLSGMLVIAIASVLPALSQEFLGRIAFQCNGLHNVEPAKIVVMQADGSLPVDLVAHRDAPAPRVTPSLSPDGTRLAFAAKVGAQFKLFSWRLTLHNTTVGDPIPLTADGMTDDKFPAWSPDGKQIAFVAVDAANKASLRVIDADGKNMRVLVNDLGFHAQPAWHPNGQGLLFIDLANKRPVLKSIPASGDPPAVTLRPQAQIVAAAYSPDGTKLAAMLRGADGLCDLWILPPDGTGGRRLKEKISGVRSVQWPSANAVIFNAVKVGAQGNNAFWVVNPETAEMRGITGYAAPSQITYFSTHAAAGDGLPAVADIAAPGPDADAPAVRTPTGPVTILRPLGDTTVRGSVPIKIITQRDVRSIVLSINQRFVYAAVPEIPPNAPPGTTYTWETQHFADFDPTRGGLPARYQDLLRYPDGDYTIRAQALDRNNRLLGADQVKVTVRNQLPDTDVPAGLVLRLRYQENQTSDERFDIRGEGMLFGVNASLAPNLIASLRATLRRNLIEVRPTGSATFRSFILPAADTSPLTFALSESAIPESRTSALYTMSPNGEIDVLTQQFDKIYLPLSLLSVPFPLTPVRPGTQWAGRMWLVADLMERQASTVRVNDVFEGLEWIGDRKTARIRSEYNLDRQVPGMKLATVPLLTTPPGIRETLAAGGSPLGGSPLGGVGTPAQGGTTAAAAAAAKRLSITRANGIRYSWFDIEQQRMLRVDDIILYEFPLSELAPQETPAATTGGKTGGAADPWGRRTTGGATGTTGRTTAASNISAWYLVRYTYSALPGTD